MNVLIFNAMVLILTKKYYFNIEFLLLLFYCDV